MERPQVLPVPLGTLCNYQTNLNHMSFKQPDEAKRAFIDVIHSTTNKPTNYIENKLKEFDDTFPENEMGGITYQYRDGGYTDRLKLVKFIRVALTDYHNHIVEKIDGLHKDEKEFIVELLKEHIGYSYTQAYNVAVDDCLQILEEIK